MIKIIKIIRHFFGTELPEHMMEIWEHKPEHCLFVREHVIEHLFSQVINKYFELK